MLLLVPGGMMYADQPRTACRSKCQRGCRVRGTAYALQACTDMPQAEPLNMLAIRVHAVNW